MRKSVKKALAIISVLTNSEDTKKSAWLFFNKCDLQDLKRDKLCLVDMNRRESFLEYAESQGVHPCGGAFTDNMKAQYFYI